jgi:hypothetical protein
MLDPDFCERRCPVCTRARKGNRIAKILQFIEMLITFGGCPWGRARQHKYGVKPNEPLPSGKQQRSRHARAVKRQRAR